MVIAVAVHEESEPNVDGLDDGVPLPLIVIPTLLIVTPEDHVQEPEGIWITSPSTAVCVGPLITAFTAAWLQDAAV